MGLAWVTGVPLSTGTYTCRVAGAFMSSMCCTRCANADRLHVPVLRALGGVTLRVTCYVWSAGGASVQAIESSRLQCAHSKGLSSRVRTRSRYDFLAASISAFEMWS